jgi:hypothetical protein
MNRLSVVHTLSPAGVDLAGRHGGGGESTNGWQDKSAAFRLGASGWSDKAILSSLRALLPALPIDTPTISTRSPPSPN